PPSPLIYSLSLHDALPIYSLRKDIVDIPKVSWLFSKHLKIDFIRNRMIDFQFLLHFFICIQVGTLRYGLFKYFFYDLLHFQTLIDRKSTRLNSSHVSISYA